MERLFCTCRLVLWWTEQWQWGHTCSTHLECTLWSSDAKSSSPKRTSVRRDNQLHIYTIIYAVHVAKDWKAPSEVCIAHFQEWQIYFCNGNMVYSTRIKYVRYYTPHSPPGSPHTQWWIPRSTAHTPLWPDQRVVEAWNPPKAHRQKAGGTGSTWGRFPEMRWRVQTRTDATSTLWTDVWEVCVSVVCLYK